MDNPLSGLLNFAAMFWAAFTAAVGALLGCLVSTATAHWLGTARSETHSGLHGFNGLLVGAGIPTFLAATPWLWGVLVLAAAGSTITTLASMHGLRALRVPALTFPFVLITWLFLFAARTLERGAVPPADAR